MLVFFLVHSPFSLFCLVTGRITVHVLLVSMGATVALDHYVAMETRIFARMAVLASKCIIICDITFRQLFMQHRSTSNHIAFTWRSIWFEDREDPITHNKYSMLCELNNIISTFRRRKNSIMSSSLENVLIQAKSLNKYWTNAFHFHWEKNRHQKNSSFLEMHLNLKWNDIFFLFFLSRLNRQHEEQKLKLFSNFLHQQFSEIYYKMRQVSFMSL